MRINHNIAALNTYRQLDNNGVNTNKSLEKLSSGLRINKAGDDAAGLAISEKMRGQIRGLDQAQRNAQDGISLIQTAEGALNETHSILQRMRELSVQAANDTNIASDRGEIQKEINQLSSEINRIAGTTEFNKQLLLDGSKSAGAVTGASLTMTKVGLDATQQSVTYTFTQCVTCTNAAMGGCTACAVTFDGCAIFTWGCADQPACTTLSGTVNELAGLMQDALTGIYNVTASGNSITITAVAGGICDGLMTCTVGFVTLSGCDSGALVTASCQTRTVVSEGSCAVCQIQKLQLSDESIKEGLKLTIGNKTIAFWNSNSGTYANCTDAKQALGADGLVDIYDAANGVLCAVDVLTCANGLVECSSFSGVALCYCADETTSKNNILVVYTSTAGAVPGAQTVASLTAQDSSSSASGTGLTLQIGANAKQTFNISFGAMDAKSIKVTGQAGGQAVVTSTNKTAYFTTTANVDKDGKTTQYALDVSSADKATAAIDAIDDAIQSVSSERSKMGAYQNRLEHTINNLGTSSENLTAAESRIRDVDMAKEMMEFTKNNILSQAAQAMLAQANQQPQGVLQLLR